MASRLLQPRKSTLRLKHYDYSAPAFYFITICTKDREPFFGDIYDQKMELSEIGHIANNYWMALPTYFPDIRVDEHIVMPNHIHGIIEKKPSTREEMNSIKWNSHESRISAEIGTIVGLYKSRCTRIINQVQDKCFFAWQRKYHDHIIRNEISLYHIREYIRLNPLKWHEDKNNPICWARHGLAPTKT